MIAFGEEIALCVDAAETFPQEYIFKENLFLETRKVNESEQLSFNNLVIGSRV